MLQHVERITLGGTPCEESCVQVGEDNYELFARKETTAYRNQLRRVAKAWIDRHPKTAPSTEDFRLEVTSHSHDFGPYLEVSAVFNPDCQGAVNLMDHLETHMPAFWDDEARKELKLDAMV